MRATPDGGRLGWSAASTPARRCRWPKGGRLDGDFRLVKGSRVEVFEQLSDRRRGCMSSRPFVCYKNKSEKVGFKIL
jgi:hypothetical protein